MNKDNKNTQNDSQSEAKRTEKLAIHTYTVAMFLVCLNLSISAIFMFATLYSDCFGMGNFFKYPIMYVGFFDVLAVGGFIFGLTPVKFTRFISFAIAGFALFCGWSFDELDYQNTQSVISNGFGLLAVSHIAVALLTFRQTLITATIIGLFGIACWITPIKLAILNSF